MLRGQPDEQGHGINTAIDDSRTPALQGRTIEWTQNSHDPLYDRIRSVARTRRKAG